MKTVIVTGGGPSGMMAAGAAASRGIRTLLFEKNGALGRKLGITGKGRCNITNDKSPDEMIGQIVSNPRFLYGALNKFGSPDVMDFFGGLGVPLTVERGGRVFPSSGSAHDIVGAMASYAKSRGAAIRLNANVRAVRAENGRVAGVVADGAFHPADAVIIATGGLSYPATGSTGDGYEIAKTLGHTVTKLRPSLVPLIAEGWAAELAGLSLRNVGASLRADDKEIYGGFGEMLFTHGGVSGPLILSASAFARDVLHKRPELAIDLKPALDEMELDRRILRDFEKNRNKALINSLGELLPLRLIPVAVSQSGIPGRKKARDVTRAERLSLVKAVKGLRLTVTGSAGYNEAVITAGGIDVNEINPQTMESKIVGGLYFAGEIVDVDALTGGYNLQIAFSTGRLAGMSV